MLSQLRKIGFLVVVVVITAFAPLSAQKVAAPEPLIASLPLDPPSATPDPLASTFTNFPANAGTLGAITDATTGCGTTPGPYRLVTFTVAGLTRPVSAVKIAMTVNHTWVGDLDVQLVAPGAQTHTIFSRTGATPTLACGDNSNVGSTYTFHDRAVPPSGGWWQAATAAADTANVAAGEYRTTVAGPVANPAAATVMNTVFAGIPGNGTWTLRIRDVSNLDTGSITGATLSIATRRVPFDFDGDAITDLIVGRCTPPGCGSTFYIRLSTNGALAAYVFGTSTDGHSFADYDGDAKTDISMWRSGASAIFHNLQSSNGAYAPFQWGTTGDSPYGIGDFDADGRDDHSVFRPSTGTWFINRSTSGFLAQPWGQNGDKLTPGDFDGDGQGDFGIKRSGVFHILRSTAGYTAVPWGLQSDLVPPGDHDGDGKTDVTAIRNESGTWVWYILRSSNSTLLAAAFGLSGDLPAPGDYDGDGKTDIAVWRPSDGTFYFLRSSDGVLGAIPWGAAGDGAIAWFLVR
jgi:subtilisin-like proprotein convertase family protein